MTLHLGRDVGDEAPSGVGRLGTSSDTEIENALGKLRRLRILFSLRVGHPTSRSDIESSWGACFGGRQFLLSSLEAGLRHRGRLGWTPSPEGLSLEGISLDVGLCISDTVSQGIGIAEGGLSPEGPLPTFGHHWRGSRCTDEGGRICIGVSTGIDKAVSKVLLDCYSSGKSSRGCSLRSRHRSTRELLLLFSLGT